MRKLLSILLVAVMLLGTTACQKAAPPASLPEAAQSSADASIATGRLTREQTAEIIFAAAAKYNAELTAEAVTQGLPADGGTATRTEALVMISNAALWRER